MPRISKDSTRSIGKVDDADSYTGAAGQEAVSPRRNIIKSSASACFALCGGVAPAKARWNRATPLRLPTKCGNMKYITVTR
ncbi:hypothetical protein K0M31_000509 [Melipona bicolor]|uniref:Uncharacterized protein n=1 Tax=Melipona bicolor TaxID=60889 RepID=A0AA40GDY9_9HYME|nr:hypothetical protein K0M31_000509 [Melipona bicolor]